MLRTTVRRRRRVIRAGWALVSNALFWVVFPYYVGTLLVKSLPSSPLTIPLFVYEFGLVITALQVASALTEGMVVSVPMLSGTHLVTAYYVWAVTGGGRLAFSAGATQFVLAFSLLVYVIIIPSLWAAAREPLAFVLQRRADRLPPAGTFPSSP
ncbi:MAG: hypothetical protein HY297_03455 [Thaumarchaeota archaeon]|nr:hypothetical protein [Nitrososphaerota archaeon]